MSERSKIRQGTARTSSTALCVVCEREGTWAVALGRALDEYGVAPRQTRSLADCERALGDAPSSIVAIELTMANVGDVLDLLTRIPRDYPHARMIVVARRLLRRYEGLMREAGAVQFVTTPRELRHVTRLVARHLARAPRQSASLSERIWAGLPWSD